MKFKKLSAAPGLVALILAGCATEPVGQMRADELKAQLDAFIAKNPSKDDFLREYGFPSACAPLTTKGELCEWLLDMRFSASSFAYKGFSVASSQKDVELVRIEFGPHSEFVSGKVIVKNGPTQYVGGKEPPPESYNSARWGGLPPPTRRNQEASSCRQGEIFEQGKCTPMQPVGMPSVPH